ncbi:MAG: prenyltransferase/squalene oxidase repeat-containing protein [Planctomycetota bacterium]
MSVRDPLNPTAHEVEQELVAYIHGERTSIPYDVIDQFIMADPVVRDAHAELLTLAAMLGHLPTAGTPSRDFVREVAKHLPRLRAEGKSTKRIENMVLRVQWTFEDRVVMYSEYWKDRVRRRPMESGALVAALIGLVLTAAWLPGQIFKPEKPLVPVSNTAASDDPANEFGGPLRDTAPYPLNPLPPEPGRPGPGQWGEQVIQPPGPTSPDFERDPSRDYDAVHAPRPPVVDGNPPVDGVNGVGGVSGVNGGPGHFSPAPTIPRGIVLPTEARVLDWFVSRNYSDEIRRVKSDERRLINEALAWLAANQNANGSWGPLAMTNNNDQMVPGAPKLPSPVMVQTTTRALLAFLADNYASREPANAALLPAHSPDLPTGAFFDQLVKRYRGVVKDGLQFLADSMDEDSGRIGASGENSMIAHAEAVQALAEDYIISHNWRYAVQLRRAVDYLLQNRNPHDGGWGHRPGAPSTLMPTVAVVQALLIYSATTGAIIDRSSGVFRHAGDFVQRCTRVDDEQGVGMADETPDWSVSVSVPRSTAAAVAVGHLLWNCGLTEPHAGFWNKSLGYLGQDRNLPRWVVGDNFAPTSGEVKCDFDYWLYFSQALSGWSRSVDPQVLTRVNAWRAAMVKVLADNAVRDSTEKRVSWPAAGWAASRGPAWATATAVLAIQNHYRYSWLKR